MLGCDAGRFPVQKGRGGRSLGGSSPCSSSLACSSFFGVLFIFALDMLAVLFALHARRALLFMLVLSILAMLFIGAVLLILAVLFISSGRVVHVALQWSLGMIHPSESPDGRI